MAHASPEDLAERFDERVIKDLASDTGVPVADITTSPVVLSVLDDASGMFEAAVLQADHYTTTELAALTGNSLALMKRIVCGIAMSLLMARRPEKYASEALAAAKKESEDYLDRLRKGDRLFNVEVHRTAGLPEVDGPCAATYKVLNLLPDRCRHFFPSRASRLPIGRG